MSARIPFVAVASACDEETVQRSEPDRLALDRARAKAAGAVLPAATAFPALVLGADTVVALGGEAIGKPRDRTDARAILARLQASTHRVITGHCLRLVGAGGVLLGEAAANAVTRVTMRAMTVEEIAAYVASGESDDRAGAYAIQEHGDRFVARLEGDLDTVVGLSVGTVRTLAAQLGDAARDALRA